MEWFYGKEGQQYGPIDEATLRARISTGEVGPKDLVWTEGMAKWTPLQEVPQFAISGGTPPELLDSGEIPSGDLGSPYSPPMSNLAGATYQPGPSLPGTNGLAIASMVCGILSLVFFCFCGGMVFGITAVICGHMGLGQLNHPDNKQQGRGMAITGLVCGYCGMAILVFMILGGETNIRFNGI